MDENKLLVFGLPAGVELKRPAYYGLASLQAIIEAEADINFGRYIYPLVISLNTFNCIPLMNVLCRDI